MINLNDLTEYLDDLLCLDQVVGDSSNNGLQVEGVEKIKKAVFGVDTSVCLIEAAIERKADFIFVHHGLSWGGGLKDVTNYNAALIRPLIKNDISLYAAHLPLDAHCTLGHNAIIAGILQLKGKKRFVEYCGVDIGFTGSLPAPMHVDSLANLLRDELCEVISSYSNVQDPKKHSSSCFILDNGRKLKKVGIISGSSGAEGVISALNEGVDCLITGELGHQNYHLAKENGLAVIAAGHYNTETPGIFRVMDIMKEKLSINTEFVDLPTGL